MSEYNVTFVRTQEEINNIRMAHPMWTDDYTTIHFYFNRDILTILILKCEEDGFMLRDNLSYYNSVKGVDFSSKLGKEVWPYLGKVCAELKIIVNTCVATETTYSDVGKALLRCYKVLTKFDITKSFRCDDKLSYWCNGKRNEDNYLCVDDSGFERTVTPKRSRKKKKCFGTNNVTRYISYWDNYIISEEELDLLLSLNAYTRQKNVKVVKALTKLYNFEQYLKNFFVLVTCAVSDIIVVDGKKRRVTRLINYELYMPKLIKSQHIFKKIKELGEYVSSLDRVMPYIDSDCFNVSRIYEVSSRVKRILWYLSGLPSSYSYHDKTAYRCNRSVNKFLFKRVPQKPPEIPLEYYTQFNMTFGLQWRCYTIIGGRQRVNMRRSYIFD